MNSRLIFHLDMDAFFASVEIVLNPALKGKAVIVGGNPDSRGVVSTCSYEARAFGVRSAMSLFQAKKLCPHGIFIEGNFTSYRSYSSKIFDLLKSYTHLVEVVSIDEAYLDVSEIAAHFGGSKNFASILRKKIYEETSLTCSIGIASNKLVAKIASSLAKPNGIYDVPDGMEAAILAPLPIQCIPGIGAKTQERLNKDGYKIIRDLKELSLDYLIQHYGVHGYHFYKESRGEDSRPVNWQERAPKSIGAETTFEKDVNDEATLLEHLFELTNKITARLTQHKMRARGISLKLRFSDFRTITRSHTLYTDSHNPETIYEQVLSLFKKNYVQPTPLRLIGVSLDKLNDSWWQPTFWD